MTSLRVWTTLFKTVVEFAKDLLFRRKWPAKKVDEPREHHGGGTKPHRKVAASSIGREAIFTRTPPPPPPKPSTQPREDVTQAHAAFDPALTNSDRVSGGQMVACHLYLVYITLLWVARKLSLLRNAMFDRLQFVGAYAFFGLWVILSRK